jgi:DNA-binding transcriptional LysR family regulator
MGGGDGVAFRGSLRDIRLFVAAYEERSFTAAAARQNTTQSGVSHHMRQLENLLGVQLFVRDKLGVTATPAADELYVRSIDILRRTDDAANRVAQFAQGYQGRFTVGMIPAVTRRLAAPTLLRFTEAHPHVKVRISESVSRLPQMILSGEVDFAIGPLAPGVAGVRGRVLLVTPECIVSRAPPGGDAPIIAPLSPEGVKLVWPTLTDERHAAIKASLEAHGVWLQSELEVRSVGAALDMVSRSDWRMVAPCLSIDPVADHGAFTVYPLPRPAVSFPIILLEPAARALTPEAEAFVEILTEIARDANDAWMTLFESADGL